MKDFHYLDGRGDFTIFDPTLESVAASRIRVYSPRTIMKRGVSDLHPFYEIRAGWLFQYGPLPFMLARPTDSEHQLCYYGGLNTAKTLFAFVPSDLYQQHYQMCLWQIARERLGTDKQVQITAFCEKAREECANFTDFTPYDHPAIEAHKYARQVAYWLQLLRHRVGTYLLRGAVNGPET